MGNGFLDAIWSKNDRKWRDLEWEREKKKTVFRERERKKAETRRMMMNSFEYHESGLPDLLTGKPVIGQRCKDQETACRMKNMASRKWRTREHIWTARIRLAGFDNRQAGYGTDASKVEFGLPKNESGNPEVRPRGREEIRLSEFEEPVSRLWGRDQSKLIRFSGLKIRLSGICSEKGR